MLKNKKKQRLNELIQNQKKYMSIKLEENIDLKNIIDSEIKEHSIRQYFPNSFNHFV